MLWQIEIFILLLLLMLIFVLLLMLLLLLQLEQRVLFVFFGHPMSIFLPHTMHQYLLIEYSG